MQVEEEEEEEDKREMGPVTYVTNLCRANWNMSMHTWAIQTRLPLEPCDCQSKAREEAEAEEQTEYQPLLRV
jgi:hypothetical protein